MHSVIIEKMSVRSAICTENCEKIRTNPQISPFFVKKSYIMKLYTFSILHNNSKHNSDSSMVDKDFSRV